MDYEGSAVDVEFFLRHKPLERRSIGKNSCSTSKALFEFNVCYSFYVIWFLNLVVVKVHINVWFDNWVFKFRVVIRSKNILDLTRYILTRYIYTRIISVRLICSFNVVTHSFGFSYSFSCNWWCLVVHFAINQLGRLKLDFFILDSDVDVTHRFRYWFSLACMDFCISMLPTNLNWLFYFV